MNRVQRICLLNTQREGLVWVCFRGGLWTGELRDSVDRGWRVKFFVGERFKGLFIGVRGDGLAFLRHLQNMCYLNC